MHLAILGPVASGATMQRLRVSHGARAVNHCQGHPEELERFRTRVQNAGPTIN
jgi:hypothetical protein